MVLELSLLATMGIPPMLKALVAQLRPKVLWATKPVLLVGKVLVTGPGTQNLFLLFLVREE